jgi:hypothetical protein
MTRFRPTPTWTTCPAELREREGPFTVSAVDPDMRELFDAPVTRDEVAAAFATNALAVYPGVTVSCVRPF